MDHFNKSSATEIRHVSTNDDADLAGTIQSVMTNVSILGKVLQADTAQSLFRSVAGTFLNEALVIRSQTNTPVLQTLESAGGLVGWTMKSKTAQKIFGTLDSLMDQGVLTPSMVTELVEKPELIKELISALAPTGVKPTIR